MAREMWWEAILAKQNAAEKGVANGYASLSNLAKVVEDPANATATPTANKIPIADGAGKLDGWVSGGPGAQAFPVGSVFLSVVSTNPATLLGYGTWSAIAAGRVLVGLDSGDTDFDTVEETGGAKTVAAAGTNSAPAISGSTAAEASHTHSVTSNVSVDDHAVHTHSVTSNVAVADHASHTHTYTQVPNHVHVQNEISGSTGNFSGSPIDTSAGGTGGTPTQAASSISTANPTGGVATGTTAGPDATLTHGVTNNAVTSGNPSATLTHTTNNPAVTSGAGSSHLHAAGTLAASAPTFTGSATSVVQPYFTVYMWKRTA